MLLLSAGILLNANINSFAQELNCFVTVINSSKEQLNDKAVFKTLENDIFSFMNNTKWTDDKYNAEERIECNFLINITKEVSLNYFKADVTIKSSRPVFQSNYNTVLLNYVDKEWNFEYNEHQPLYYNENAFLSNLTSMLAFYAYIIIGLDYDSFSPKGGTLYYQKAQDIVNNAQNASEAGWKSHESLRNRYWLIENLLNPTFEPLRDALYKYHRIGLDIAYSDLNKCITTVLNSLRSLLNIHRRKPNSMIMQLFFNAKSKELINMFKTTLPNEKTKAVQLLSMMDASNTSEYQKILK